MISLHGILRKGGYTILLAVFWVFSRPNYAQPTIQFHDVTSETGISFRHDDGSTGKYFLHETMSGGLALFDYDQDGHIDIYFLNGSRLTQGSNQQPRNTLYRNEGNWKFKDATDETGVGHRGHALGVAVADYDNDGDPDIYVTNYGRNVLYRNEGNGTFSDQTERAKVGNDNRFGAGTCFFDMENDGDLDLYVANYVNANPNNLVPRTKSGYLIYGSPADYPSQADTLFRNNGDGTFEDVSKPSGIERVAAPGMGMVCCDYDNDGDTDIFVANDGVANFLFQNDGKGHFQEIGFLSGFAYDAAGKTHASMGVDAADFNNDGRIDFHVTSFQAESATLYENVRGNFLEDVSTRSGAGTGTRSPVTWGNGFADFDNDGDRDIFIACGHLYDLLHKFDQTTTYLTPNVVLENKIGHRFANISTTAGDGLRVKGTSRGAAFDDLDNDGDIDAVILNNRGRPTLLRNDTSNKNNWLQIKLAGVDSNRDGVGARVTVTAGELKQVAEVHSGRGYQSHFGTRLHFGLGSNGHPVEIRVKWPSGQMTVARRVNVNQLVMIREKSKD